MLLTLSPFFSVKKSIKRMFLKKPQLNAKDAFKKLISGTASRSLQKPLSYFLSDGQTCFLLVIMLEFLMTHFEDGENV